MNPGFVLFGTYHQGVPVISKELVLPGGFDLVSLSFTVRDVTTELSGPQLTSFMTEMYSQLIDHWVMVSVPFECISNAIDQVAMWLLV
ncbi:unnamed protein product [Schistosoma margrebowiei]|uniref:Uncharacterized protein n=1 Tax=Schistosoma margrebowiei TaxID=48269 RepID=A0A3P8A504_9TREM|nr:unnamed protein product [Schistosoma margrebowiei]